METTSFTYKTGPCSDVLIIGGGLRQKQQC